MSDGKSFRGLGLCFLLVLFALGTCAHVHADEGGEGLITVAGNGSGELAIVPVEDFWITGKAGGPFTPSSKQYQITNTSDIQIAWGVSNTVDWVDLDSTWGLLEPDQSVTVTVSLNGGAENLAEGVHTDTITFTRITTPVEQHTRSVIVTVAREDWFTESFAGGDNDLDFLCLSYIPYSSRSGYRLCQRAEDEFPTDPAGGNFVTLADDDFVEVILENGAEIPFFGQKYDRFYIGSNGYITLGQGDTEYDAKIVNHFLLPRISALFTDLTPGDSQSVSWKQLADRAVVTYDKVPLYGDKDGENSFQIEMFFADGIIKVTYLNLDATRGIAGLSRGQGRPGNFVESNLSDYMLCCSCGDFNGDYWVDLYDVAVVSGQWLRSDCSSPFWCEHTDVNRNHSVDAADLLCLAENWLSSRVPRFFGWSEPVLLPELNDTVNNYEASKPFVTPDQLKIYYNRLISAGVVRMYVATRTDIDQPFTVQRELSELGHALWPWLSQDELRLYYTAWNGTELAFKMASRENTSQTWTVTKTFPELQYDGYQDYSLSLTADEKIVYFDSARPGGSGSVNIWKAVRSSTNASFTDITLANELNLLQANGGQFILPDGLTMYFRTSDPENGIDVEVYKATRVSINDLFGNISHLTTIDGSDFLAINICIIPDEETFYFSSNRRDDGKGVWVSQWGANISECLPR